MADKNTTKIIDLKIKGAEALGTIEALTKELAKEKKTLAELNEVAKTANGLSKDQKEEMLLAAASSKQLQKEISQQTSVLKNNVAESRAVSGSLKEMRAQYNTLKTTYEGLSKVQRDALIPQMKELKNRIEEADKAVGNYGTSVGNYEQAITNALPGFGKFQQVISGLGISADQSAKVMAGNVVTSLKAVGSSMKALMANPLIAGIAVILATILAIKEAINKNQQAMDALQKIAAPFALVIESFFRGLGELVGVMAEGISKFMEFIIPANGALNDSIKAQKILQQIRKEDIMDLELNSKGNLKVAELRDKLLQKETYSAKQRIQFAKDIRAELQRQADDEAKDAREKVRAFELQNALALRNMKRMEDETVRTGKLFTLRSKNAAENTVLTDKELLEYQQLKSAVDNIKAAEFDRSRFVTKATNTAIAEINNEKDAAKRAEAEKRKEYAKTAEQRAAERIKRENDEKEVAIKATEAALKAEQKRLADILFYEQAYYDEELALNSEMSKRLNRQREDADKLAFQNRRAIAEMNGLAIFDFQKAELSRQMDLELSNTLLTEDEKALIRERYRQEDLNLEEQKTNAKLNLASQFVKSLGGIFDEGTVAAKGIASVQIAIDGISGAFAAYNSMVKSGIPAPFNFIAGGVAAAATAAATGVAISKVWAVKKQKNAGGGGGTNPVSNSPITAPSVPSQPSYKTTTLNLGSSDAVSRGSQLSQSDAIKSAIKEAYASMPAPQVKVVDIQSATVQADNIKNVSVI